jgi:histidinol dehydrogenase
MMLAIPAKIAGCKEIIVATPPEKNGRVNPNILYTAHLLGLKKIFKIGGAQAIAAMAYGTESIPNVYKIFGPGNRFVTKAKELVQLDGVPIDMPAGPSEVLIVADESSNPRFVAADLLSQAEHGPDSQAVLLSNTEKLVEEVMIEIEKQIRDLPRRDLAAQSIENSFALVLKDIRECIDFSNMYAPEHLILAVTSPRSYSDYIVNAGSVFLGEYSCESLGDYASGTNHTLPTNGFARSFSGVSVDSFVKKITFQEISVEGLMNIGPAVEVLAEAENLAGHKNAVSLRLKGLNRD